MNTTVSEGLKGWTKLVIVGDVTACDPGINNTSSYKGEALCHELMLGQDLRQLITSEWWASEISRSFSSLKIIDITADGAVLEYGGEEIEVLVGSTKKIDNVGLSYAYATLYVSIIKDENTDTINSRWIVSTRKEYEEIVADAQAGNADAMNHWAYILYYGIPRLNIARDKQRANQLWKDAADKGNAFAQYCFGVSLFNGDVGVEKDKKQAFELYRKAAKQGNIFAVNKLGDIYYTGLEGVVEQDFEKAFDYYMQAAKEEKQDAVAMVGMMYYDGQGTVQDYGKAFHYLDETAYSDNRWASQWSCFYLGRMYQNGFGVEKDEKKALGYFEYAAEQGLAAAMVEVGYMYCMGYGCVQDLDKAVSWFKKGTEAGDANAAYYLAIFYEDPQYGNDPEKADFYQQKAADMGNEDAEREIALGLRPGEKQTEKEVEEDMQAGEDYEALLDSSMSNPTEHARVIWRGVKHGNLECMRRYLYVAYNCQADDEISIVAGWLAEEGDERAKLYQQFKKNVPDANPLSLYCMAFFDKEGSPYAPIYGDMIYTLCRLHANGVGFFENDEPSEDVNTDTPDAEDVKYWYSMYNRSDCSSNQIGIYRDALPYALGGNADAEFIVGSLLLHGIKTKYSSPDTVYLEPDKQKAKEWLEKAAAKGINKAYRELPYTCEYRSDEWLEYVRIGAEAGEPENLELWQQWLLEHDDAQEAAKQCLKRVEQGSREAMLKMADYYLKGYGVKTNPEEAFRLVDYVYHHSSVSPYSSVHEDAAELLQKFYEEGIGVAKDPDKAWEIYTTLKSDMDDLEDSLTR